MCRLLAKYKIKYICLRNLVPCAATPSRILHIDSVVIWSNPQTVVSHTSSNTNIHVSLPHFPHLPRVHSFTPQTFQTSNFILLFHFSLSSSQTPFFTHFLSLKHTNKHFQQNSLSHIFLQTKKTTRKHVKWGWPQR